MVGRLLSDDYTICGRKIPPDTKIHNKMPKNKGFCKKCNEYVGKYMMTEYLGLEFFDTETPANSIEAARKHHAKHGDMDGKTCLLSKCALHYPLKS